MTDLDRILHHLAEQGSRAAGQADPSEIRRIGDVRRRRRIAGGIAAVCVAIVVAVIGGSVAFSAMPHQPIPVVPANPAPRTSPTPEHHRLADDPFPSGAFGWPGSYDDLRRTDNPAEFMPLCLRQLDDLGADDVQAVAYTGELEGAVNVGALEFSSAVNAREAVTTLVDLPDACYASPTNDRDTIVHEPREREAGDEAYVFAYESIPNENNPGSGTSYFGYGVVREANVVVVIEFGAMSMPVEGKPYATWSADQLAELTNKAIG
jgi:hypothetical protein